MRSWPYLNLSGLEIANANRTLTYVRLFAPGGAQGSQADSCYCDEVDDGPYLSPASDPAPWYIGTEESEDFLGIWANDIKITGSTVRRAIEKGAGGAVLTRPRRQHKTITVNGRMFARSAPGMAYGEQWLKDALTARLGCSVDTLEVLRACPDGVTGAPGKESLTKVGLIDAPLPLEIPGVPECYMQGIYFQLASETGLFQSITPSTCMAATVLPDDDYVYCSFIGADSGDTATKLTIVAGSADVSGIEIFGQPCGGYVDPYDDIYDDDSPGTMRYAEYRVTSIPAGHRLEIDAAAETVKLVNIASGQVVGGFETLTFRGAFEWIRAEDGTSACLYVSALPTDAVVNAGTTVEVETIERHA